MAYALCKLRVKDFDAWKAGFDCDEGQAFRKRTGQKSCQVFRVVDEPDSVVVLVDWGDLENCRRQAESEELAEINRQSGVADMTDVWYLEPAESGTVQA